MTSTHIIVLQSQDIHTKGSRNQDLILPWVCLSGHNQTSKQATAHLPLERSKVNPKRDLPSSYLNLSSCKIREASSILLVSQDYVYVGSTCVLYNGCYIGTNGHFSQRGCLGTRVWWMLLQATSYGFFWMKWC